MFHSRREGCAKVQGLPWEHQGYKERIDALEKAQKAFEKKPWPAYPSQVELPEMRQQYDQFRATVERVIQDVVFNGVVKRYRDWIRVDRCHGLPLLRSRASSSGAPWHEAYRAFGAKPIP